MLCSLSLKNVRENGEIIKYIFDFVQRVNLSACNRKNIENLALAGAFDSFTGIKREDFFVKNAKDETFTEVLVRYGNKYQMDKAAAANSLIWRCRNQSWSMLLPKSFDRLPDIGGEF